MSCYDIYDMLHDLECGVSINFVFKLLPYLYCDPIYEVTRTTRGVLRNHLHDLRVYLQITCTVMGYFYYIYGATRMTRGVPTKPLAQLWVYLRITEMFMESVPTITRTTRGVPTKPLTRFRGVRTISLA